MKKVLYSLLIACSALSVNAQHVLSDTLLNSMTITEVDSFRQSISIAADSVVQINYGIDIYRITYTTTNAQGTDTTHASGLLILPNSAICPLPISTFAHGTVANKTLVPSRMSPEAIIGMLMAADGYVSVMPDYLGLGDSPGMHPYVHAKSEATATIDMIFAAKEFAATKGVELNDQLFLMGYSQGGHAAMATHREIQLNYANQLTVTASSPLSGPYDISGVQGDLLKSNDPYPDPSYLPYVLFAYQSVYGNLYNDVSDILVPPYDSILPPMFDGTHNTWNINAVMPDVPKNIIIPAVFAAIGLDTAHPVAVALRDNDTWRGWVPQAPIQMVYCGGDDAVTPLNAQVAKSHFEADGATDITLVNAGDTLNHAGCRLPALLTGKHFFDGFRVKENNLPVTVTGSAESTPGSHDAHASVRITGTGYTVQWSNGSTDTAITGLADGTYTVTVTNANGCDKVRSVTLGTTGVANGKIAAIKVYPNPATDAINIDLGKVPEKPVTVTLYDFTGRRVMALTTFETSIKMERGSLSAGVYLLEVQGEKTFRQKVVFH
jgi:hypothetical protein